MARLCLLSLLIILLPLARQQEARGLPPDKVPGSPVPSLKQQKPRTSISKPSRWTSSRLTGLEDFVQKPQTTIPESRQPSQFGDESLQEESSYDEVKLNLWNSADMLTARQLVTEFCRRAAQTSPEEGKQFLTQLSELPLGELRDWLERFQRRRKGVALGQEVDALTRRLRVGQSLSRIEARRKAAENVAEFRRQATLARQQYPTTQPFRQRVDMGVGDITRGFGFEYDPMEAVVDPSSPRGVARQVAASWSLPGDLPRSDPRNFIRGEEGVDFGEWATTRNAQPPSLAAPPIVIAPAPSVSAPTAD